MIKDKSLLNYTNLFSICGKCKNVDEKIFKEEKSIENLKMIALFENI